MKLTTPKQLRQTMMMNKEQYQHYLIEGMPHLLIGEKVRFNKEEVVHWLQNYIMKQENLEKNFVDQKGRTLETYLSTSELKEILQLKKKEIRALCKDGMPYQLVGKKRFFYLNEVLAYLQPNIEAQVEKKVDNADTVIIVDGSYYPKTKETCVGIVVQNNKGIQGMSKLHEGLVQSSMFCEYLALYHALSYVKEHNLSNVVIGTDQKNFVNLLNKGEIEFFNWMKKAPYRETMHKMYELLKELDEQVTIVYANVSKYENLYHNAHALSRRYQNTVVESLSPDQRLSVATSIKRKKAPSNSSLLSQTIVSNANTVHIKFDEMDDQYSYFQVNNAGKLKRIRLLKSTATRDAILMAYAYIQAAKGKLTIIIDDIPSFQEDVQSLSWLTKLQQCITIIEKLYKVADFQPSNDLKGYVEEMKEKEQVA